VSSWRKIWKLQVNLKFSVEKEKHFLYKSSEKYDFLELPLEHVRNIIPLVMYHVKAFTF